MSIQTRLQEIEKQFGMEREIKRQFFVLCGPKPKPEAGQTAQEAEIERLMQEVMNRDPQRRFHYISLVDGPLKEWQKTT